VLPEVVISSAGRIPSAFHFFAFSSLLPDNPAYRDCGVESGHELFWQNSNKST
jgi:hypothetical protein